MGRPIRRASAAAAALPDDEIQRLARTTMMGE